MHKFNVNTLAAWFKKFNQKELNRKGVRDFRKFAKYVIDNHSMNEGVNEMQMVKPRVDYILYLCQWNGTWKGLLISLVCLY